MAAQAQTAPWSWSGFYLGAHIGTAAMHSDWKSGGDVFNEAVPFAGQYTGGGILQGLQAGYNHQVGRFVMGVEVEASFADIDGTAHCAVAIFTCTAKIDALGAFTGRLGYAHDKFLVYGKGGAAWAHQKTAVIPSPDFNAESVWHGKQFRWGWTAGIGVEYALSPLLSAKLEYDYLSFNNGQVNVTDQAGAAASLTLRQDTHLLKFGLNAKFGETGKNSGAVFASGTAPVWDWTGVYVGIHSAGVLGQTDWNSATGVLDAFSTLYFPGSGRNEGLALGGQIGINRQIGHWVAGAEIDAAWASIDGYAKCATRESPEESYRCHTHMDALGTVTARLGWAHDNFLFYGKAGAAWARSSFGMTPSDFPNVFNANSTRFGYVVGSGIEYAFNSAWSGRLEYNYVDLGDRKIAFNDQFGNISDIGIGQQIHLFKMGLNYKLGADPAQGEKAFARFAKAPALQSDWEVEVGARYWFSNGKSQLDLYDPSERSVLNSRLIYADMNGHSAETFVRADHRSGFFIKGNFGAGLLVNGLLNDEDFPPAETIYSNTAHEMRDGGLRYGSLDLGYNFIDSVTGRLGAFAGYRYFHQRGRGFGCTQIASGAICADMLPDHVLGLSTTEEYRGAAVGLNAQLALSPRLKFEVDAAFLPYLDRAGVDNHWNRADINPAPEIGRGWGTQLEAILSYAVTERLNLGIGGRYWFVTTTSAETRFPSTSEVSPIKFTSDRYGGFVQASYKIGGDVTRWTQEQAPPANWAGVYVGGHVGAGFGRSNWDDPFPAPPTGDRVLTGGALGGAQIGVNYQAGRTVFGAELSASLGRVEGAETCFGGIQPGTLAGLNCENRIGAVGTMTGRVGYAFDQSLLYAKAGAAVASQKYTLNSLGLDGEMSSSSTTNWGWTAGAGIEHALDTRWSVNFEYKYLDFGADTVAFSVPAAIAAVASEKVSTHLHLLTLGVNYRFP